MRRFRLNAKRIAALVLLFFAVLCLIGMAFTQANIIERENTRLLATQRLGIDEETDWQGISDYFDCEYIETGIPYQELLVRLSKLDGFLVSPVNGTSVSVEHEGDTADLATEDFSITVRFNAFHRLNRDYYLDSNGIVRMVTTIPTGLRDIVSLCDAIEI